jgi:hypothetical protein
MVVTGLVVVVAVVILHTPAMGGEAVEVEEVVRIQLRYLASSHPFSLGIDNSTLWYSVPYGCFHNFYIGCVAIVSMNSIGLGIGVYDDVLDDAALDNLFNIQPKTYEYKDVKRRGTRRVYGFISQQIDLAEIIPEAVSTQKGTLYDIYSNF